MNKKIIYVLLLIKATVSFADTTIGNNIIPLIKHIDEKSLYSCINIDFSDDSSCIMLWWISKDVPMGYPVNGIVFGNKGNLLSSWSEKSDNYIFNGFSKFSWCRYINNKNIIGGCISIDGRKVFLASSGPKANFLGSNYNLLVLECLYINKENKTRTLFNKFNEDKQFNGFEKSIAFEDIGLYNDENNVERLFLGLSGTTGKVIDIYSGIITETVNYKNNNLYASKIAFNPSNKIVAIGYLGCNNIKVISIIKPYKTVFKTNNNKTSFMGEWGVEELKFSAFGKYLIVTFHYSGRGIIKPKRETIVYSTDKWEEVWHTTDVDTHSVYLSNDGKKIAYINKNILYITDLFPIK